MKGLKVGRLEALRAYGPRGHPAALYNIFNVGLYLIAGDAMNTGRIVTAAA